MDWYCCVRPMEKLVTRFLAMLTLKTLCCLLMKSTPLLVTDLSMTLLSRFGHKRMTREDSSYALRHR